ncbi:MAG: D-alanyl-D-alanine carboxypeptidase [Clostridium lundense]|nr:D-alanyl-D-alanine carboxypeptidase [Clostridium lundense]
MKKICKFFLNVIILLTLFLNNTVSAAVKPPEVSADGAILMDASTGEVIYSKNMTSPYPPASTTKIMTALLTLENCDLEDVVTVGSNPPFADGSKIYISEGEQFTVNDLLYALLLASANDVAEALAEHISGSKEDFVKLMNKRALELGATSTNFVNPNGLYDTNHKTSAKDLAIIMRELVKHPEYTKISTTSSYKIAPTNKMNKERPLWNGNRLIQKSSEYYYSDCQGGKTGYTIQSEHSYVATAERNGQKLILTLIHDKNKTYFKDAANLFDYGFNNFEVAKLYSQGELVTNYEKDNLSIPLLAEKDFYYVKEKDSSSVPAISLNNKDTNILDNAFKKGDILSEGTITLNDKSLGSLKLLAGQDYEPKKFLNTATSPEKLPIIKYIASFTFVLLILLLIIEKIKQNRRKKRLRGRY